MCLNPGSSHALHHLNPPLPKIDMSDGESIPPKRAPADQRSNRLIVYLRKDWLRCLLLAATGFLVHLPALQGRLLWDDEYLARDNPFIKSPLLIFEVFRHYLFLDSFSAHYRPVQNISFIVDYFFWNTNTYGYHLTNLVLHVASGLLLYFLLRTLWISLRRTQTTFPRENDNESLVVFFVAFLWIVHPVHSAAVDYISGRADSLAFVFGCGGWLIFLRARRIISKRTWATFYFIAALCGLVALCSRETACIWLGLFLIHTFFFDKTLGRRAKIVSLFCCMALLASYGALRHLPGQRITIPPSDGWSKPVRIVLMLRALGDYGRLMIFPSNLHMERTVIDPATYESNADWRQAIGIEYLSVLGLFVFAALLYGSARRGSGQSMRIFGASWFLGAFLPISNIVQLNATVAEHWLYLPSVGFLIFAAGCAVELPRRHWKIAVVLVLVAIAGLGARSYVRSTDWVTAEDFYRRTIMAGGTSARTGLNLGQAYAARGAYAEAEQIFRRVIELAPDYPLAQNNLADLLYRRGKTKEAEILFARVEKDSVETRKEYPRTWIGALNHAVLRHNAHENDSAIAILDKARDDYPGVWPLISLESEVLRQMHQFDAALRLVEDFDRKNWWHYGAALALGRLYAEKGDGDRAEAALRRASWLDVHDTKALRLIVLMRLRQNRLSDAFQTQRRAVARQPDEPRQYILLSNILEKMGRGDEARDTLARASYLRALAQNQTIAN